MDIKQQLIQHAEELMELADRLSIEGKKLNTRDKELIRGAFVSCIKGLTEELIVSFIAGHEDMISESFQQLDKVIGKINRL